MAFFTKKIISLVFILVIVLDIGIAQNGQNPFDLDNRKKPTTSVPASVPASTGNPFDIDKQGQMTLPVSGTKANSNNPFEKGKVLPGATSSSASDNSVSPGTTSDDRRYLFWVLLFGLLFFTAIVSSSRRNLQEAYQAFRNDNFLRQVHRSNRGSFPMPYLLLYLSFFMQAGLFIYLSIRHFEWIPSQHFVTFVLLFLAVVLLFLGKHLFLKLVSSIFPIKKELSLYSYSIVVFNIILGIPLIPVNFLLAYAPGNIPFIALYSGISAIIAIYAYRSLRGIAIGSKYLVLHKFHFLLYLCTIEILPLIVLLKIILSRID